MRFTRVSPTHPAARTLVDELQREYELRYGEADATPVDPAEFTPPHGLFLLVRDRDGTPVACGGWRQHRAEAETVELKRMFVLPAVRGQGVARSLLGELENAAAAAGYSAVVLETGLEQPEALGLYLAAGYDEIAPFGCYQHDPSSRYFGKPLPAPATGGTPAAGEHPHDAGAADT